MDSFVLYLAVFEALRGAKVRFWQAQTRALGTDQDGSRTFLTTRTSTGRIVAYHMFFGFS
jgi:hypothetical protein